MKIITESESRMLRGRTEVVGKGERLQTKSSAMSTARRGAKGWTPLLCVYTEQRDESGEWREVEDIARGKGRSRKRYLPLRNIIIRAEGGNTCG